eukprot:TRINITY_DN36522_c0_g3_i3.p1 TRINITY_DN36522_c0_g3~~TRINITY_DN36522_c0_g3_i3.p1  ORF type:complete len:306 (-),score=-17.86 TRINITY_DN36522_c0_g3_i3:160-1077(-)
MYCNQTALETFSFNSQVIRYGGFSTCILQIQIFITYKQGCTRSIYVCNSIYVHTHKQGVCILKYDLGTKYCDLVIFLTYAYIWGMQEFIYAFSTTLLWYFFFGLLLVWSSAKQLIFVFDISYCRLIQILNIQWIRLVEIIVKYIIHIRVYLNRKASCDRCLLSRFNTLLANIFCDILLPQNRYWFNFERQFIVRKVLQNMRAHFQEMFIFGTKANSFFLGVCFAFPLIVWGDFLLKNVEYSGNVAKKIFHIIYIFYASITMSLFGCIQEGLEIEVNILVVLGMARQRYFCNLSSILRCMAWVGID